ncbi:hypothetical protein AS188_07370 [Kocuria flava]|uniref:Uncharacterized protein n=1 Tax=Kocuria flava TaxID=446860 RepID=A0A0U3HW38_9MICC|nr:hypothetical protein [Kocuria flava]ALU39599.1 hypothetical protein AS188_07370 [Kocuria flava]GEO91383.1 hypothetical protein KFL01_06890 [Kocuria flava]
MRAQFVDESGQPVDVSLAVDGLVLGALVGLVSWLVGHFTAPVLMLLVTPALGALAVWRMYSTVVAQEDARAQEREDGAQEGAAEH